MEIPINTPLIPAILSQTIDSAEKEVNIADFESRLVRRSNGVAGSVEIELYHISFPLTDHDGIKSKSFDTLVVFL